MKNISSLLSFSLLVSLAGCVVNGDDTNDTDAADTSASTTVSTTAMSASESGSADTGSADSGSADSGSADSGSADSDSADSGSADGGGMSCNYTCSGDGDCTIGGNDVGLICQDSTCQLANPCTDDSACVAQLSGWSFSPCTMGGGECSATMQICVDLGDGTGGCATPPSEFIMCSTLMQDEVMVTNLDDGSEVTVCGNTSGVCNTDAGTCYVPCVDDSTCGTLVCDTDSGNCVCDSDDDCGEGGTCDVAAGTCSVPGCMTDDDCTNPFDGGTISCG